MRLIDLTKKTRKITVSYMGETAEIEYKLAAVTPSFITEIKAMSNLDSIICQIAKTVTKWDVTDENGLAISPTEENVRKFDIPVGFLSQVLTSISEDMNSWDKSEKKD